MATIIKTKTGKDITLLNPSEKSKKYASELKTGHRYTNKGEYKVDKDGVVLNLDCCSASYRMGYLAARKDNAKVYNAKMGIKSKAKPKIKKNK